MTTVTLDIKDIEALAKLQQWAEEGKVRFLDKKEENHHRYSYDELYGVVEGNPLKF